MKLTEKIHQLQINFEINVGPGKKISRFVNVLIILGDRINLVDTGVKGSEELIFQLKCAFTGPFERIRQPVIQGG